MMERWAVVVAQQGTGWMVMAIPDATTGDEEYSSAPDAIAGPHWSGSVYADTKDEAIAKVVAHFNLDLTGP
jgi:hypothetical protein